MKELFGFLVGVFSMFLFTTPINADHFPKGSVGHDLQTKFKFDKSRLSLYMVGNFLAAHKYFGADYRYLAGDITEDDQVFYKKFPSRPLRELHKELAKQCRRSVESCLRRIYDTAKVSGTMYKFFNRKDEKSKVPIFEPFENAYDMFIFRQTATYFMCSYAVNWKKLGSKVRHLQYSGRPGCLDKLVYVHDVSEEKRRAVLLNRPAYIVKDERARPGRNLYYNGVMCSLVWFCPDPCFGRKSRGNVYRAVGYSGDMGNKCRHLPDPTCHWDWKANGNFGDLIRNKVNITCNCASGRKGFVWNNEFDLCVDKDECHDETVTCDHDKVCRNTVGSYRCTCPKGYRDNSTAGRCEQTSVISENKDGYSLAAPAHRTTVGMDDDEDIISDMMAFVGLSAGSFVYLCYTHIISALFISLISVYLML